MSKFDFATFKWETFNMESMFNIMKIPRIVDCATVSMDNGQILFVNERRTGNCYLNDNNKKLSKCGKLSKSDSFLTKGIPVIGVFVRNHAYLVSHEATDEDRVVVHVCDLMDKKWSRMSGVLI